MARLWPAPYDDDRVEEEESIWGFTDAELADVNEMVKSNKKHSLAIQRRSPPTMQISHTKVAWDCVSLKNMCKSKPNLSKCARQKDANPARELIVGAQYVLSAPDMFWPRSWGRRARQ